jgi:hypothetical protein
LSTFEQYLMTELRLTARPRRLQIRVRRLVWGKVCLETEVAIVLQTAAERPLVRLGNNLELKFAESISWFLRDDAGEQPSSARSALFQRVFERADVLSRDRD